MCCWGCCWILVCICIGGFVFIGVEGWGSWVFCCFICIGCCMMCCVDDVVCVGDCWNIGVFGLGEICWGIFWGWGGFCSFIWGFIVNFGCGCLLLKMFWVGYLYVEGFCWIFIEEMLGGVWVWGCIVIVGNGWLEGVVLFWGFFGFIIGFCIFIIGWVVSVLLIWGMFCEEKFVGDVLCSFVSWLGIDFFVGLGL